MIKQGRAGTIPSRRDHSLDCDPPARLGWDMPFSPFVPLRVLSSYTMLEGAIDPKAIAALAKERGFPAIAICDRNGLYGTPTFAAACKAEGVQPIIGAMLGVSRGPEGPIDY